MYIGISCLIQASRIMEIKIIVDIQNDYLGL